MNLFYVSLKLIAHFFVFKLYLSVLLIKESDIISTLFPAQIISLGGLEHIMIMCLQEIDHKTYINCNI